MATIIEPSEWEVRPDGIESTRFADPESFYLSIRRGRDDCFIVSYAGHAAMGFTKHGKAVYLRHDPNARHARLDTFEEAAALARGLAEGTITSQDYTTWRAREAQRWPE
jgi:hypothetical protein